MVSILDRFQGGKVFFSILGGFLLFFTSNVLAAPNITTSTINNGADRIFVSSTASQTVVFAIVNDGDAVVEQIVIDPPTNVTITDWTLNHTTAGTAGTVGSWSDGTATGVANNTPTAVTLAEGAALTLTGADGATENGVIGSADGALTLTIEFDTGATVGVSGDWAISGNAQDDGGGAAATASPSTFKIAVVGEDDLAFDIVANGGTVGTVANIATGSIYIYDPDGTNFAIADWTNVKKTLSNGLAVYENGTDFTGTADGTFDYAITGTNEGTVVSDQAYDFTGGANHFAAARGADITAPTISSVQIDKNISGNNIFTINYDQPVLVDALLAATDPISTGIASTANLGDMTTAKQLEGIASFDGSADMTSLTLKNTVKINDTFTTLTVVVNGQDGGYFTAGSTGASSDTYTEIASSQIVNPSQDQATAAAGPAATISTIWDVTAPTIDTLTTQDADTDGNVDRVELVFSESMDDSDFAAAHFELGDVAGNALSTTNCAGSDADADDEKMCLTLLDGTEVTGTALATVDIVTAGGTDLAGNRIATGDDLGSTKNDGASPVLMAVYSYDVDTTTDAALDGDVDEIYLTFSESISDATVADDEISALLDDALTVDNNDYSLDSWVTGMSFRTNSGTDQVEHASTDADNDQYLTFEPTAASVLNGTGAVLVRIIASFADATGNVVIPGYYKKKVGAHTLISDADGDFSAGSSDLGANYGYRDMALPQLLTAATGDQDANGLIDHYTLTFSETILETTLTDANANGWAVADFGAATGGTSEILHEASALNDSAFDDTDQAVFYLAFAEDAAAAYSTGGTGVKPALSYVDDNISGTSDYTALELAAIADATETDAAAPIYSIAGTSVNAAGDTVALTFTEAMDPTTITNAIVQADTNVTLDYSDDAGNTNAANITVTNATVAWTVGDTIATITLNETTDFAYIPSAKFVGVTLASVTDLVANAEAGAERYTAAGVTAETTVPTVTALGTGLIDYYLAPGATGDLVFGEVLSTAGKTAVQNALDAGADNAPQSYSWSGATLTITAHATLDTLFRNDITADITDLVGNTSAGVTIIDSLLHSGSYTSCNKPGVLNFSEEVSAPLNNISFSVAPAKVSSAWKQAGWVKERLSVKVNDVLVSSNNIEVIAPKGNYTSQVIVNLLPAISEPGRIPVVITVAGEPDKSACNLNRSYTLNIKGAPVPTSSSSSSGGSGGSGGGGSSSSSSSSSSTSIGSSTTTAPRVVETTPVVSAPPPSRSVVIVRDLSRMKTFKSSAPGREFKDVFVGDWEEPYINKVSSAGIMTGYKDGSQHFGKNDLITNAQILKVGLESFGEAIPSSVSSAPYQDVQVGEWFTPYVQRAKELGITTGIENNKLNPNRPINRGEALKYLVTMAGVNVSGLTGQDNDFVDLDFRSAFAPHVLWATKNNIVNGYAPDSNGRRNFGPQDPLTRGQLAKIIVNLLEFLAR